MPSPIAVNCILVLNVSGLYILLSSIRMGYFMVWMATSVVPEGVSLSHFVAIVFDMNADDFTRATVTVSYNDNELAGMDEPYSVYKYLPSSDSYVALSTYVDTTAMTMTVVSTGVDDPILAIGGLTVEPAPDSTTTWVIVAVAIVIIVVLAVFLVFRWRRM